MKKWFIIMLGIIGLLILTGCTVSTTGDVVAKDVSFESLSKKINKKKYNLCCEGCYEELKNLFKGKSKHNRSIK